jgi:pimeloyl-ACP methyl ester carboxylesterase
MHSDTMTSNSHPGRGKAIPKLESQNVGGAELPYLHYQGNGGKTVFCHATGFLPWLWHPVIQELNFADAIWAPYICNYREGDPHNGGLSWNDIARDLSSFCRACDINQPLMIGHSMGATVSIITAAAFDIKPRGMILIEPILLPEEFYELNIKVEDHPLASKSIKRLNRWKNVDEATSYLHSRPLFSDWDKDVLDLYKNYGLEKMPEGDVQLACTPQSEAALFMGGMSRNPWPLLSAIECPTLVIEGGKSPNIGLVDIQRAVSLLQRGKYAVVPEAGHLIPMQKPSEIAALINGFVKEIAAKEDHTDHDDHP